MRNGLLATSKKVGCSVGVGAAVLCAILEKRARRMRPASPTSCWTRPCPCPCPSPCPGWARRWWCGSTGAPCATAWTSTIPPPLDASRTTKVCALARLEVRLAYVDASYPGTPIIYVAQPRCAASTVHEASPPPLRLPPPLSLLASIQRGTRPRISTLLMPPYSRSLPPKPIPTLPQWCISTEWCTCQRYPSRPPT